MKIINKSKRDEYDIEYNEKDLLKLSKLILEFLQKKKETNPKTLYKIITYFYDIKLDDWDYVRYINKKNNTDFYKITVIPTSRVIMDIQSEGHGRDFSWWTQNYQRMMLVATKQFNPSKEEYTFEEIKELIDASEIYPIYPFGEKTKKKPNNLKDDTKYLVSYLSKELDYEDEYFDFMVGKMIGEIGYKTLLNIVREFIINLKLNVYITWDSDYEQLDNTSDVLIQTFNENNKNNKINTSPVEIVLQYLRDLPYEEIWYEKVNMEQIIGVISMLDYETDKAICNEIQEIAIRLKEVELCYELARNCDWVDKNIMAEIVIQDGSPDFNYYFATEVEGADIKRHKEVILNNKRSDGYILERARKLYC